MRVVQFFWGSALQDRAGRPGGRPLRRRYKRCGALSAGGQRRPPLRRVARSACVRDDVGIVPYGSVIDGAVGRGDVGIAPYGIVSWGA